MTHYDRLPHEWPQCRVSDRSEARHTKTRGRDSEVCLNVFRALDTQCTNGFFILILKTTDEKTERKRKRKEKRIFLPICVCDIEPKCASASPEFASSPTHCCTAGLSLLASTSALHENEREKTHRQQPPHVVPCLPCLPCLSSLRISSLNTHTNITKVNFCMIKTKRVKLSRVVIAVCYLGGTDGGRLPFILTQRVFG